jgi:alkylation response protein AidB-like acyl-CoA dehydrogenase
MNHSVTDQGSLTLSTDFSRWLDESADGLDDGTIAPSTLLPAIAQAGLPKAGVPEEWGGWGGSLTDAVTTIAAVSGHSLSAGFVLWGHRTYIEYLLQSPNTELRNHLLPRLLNGELAGASGLSNAMKFLSGLEDLQIQACSVEEGYVLSGKLAWVTNLRPEAFHVAAAVQRQDGKGSFVISLGNEDEGVNRSDDLDLIGLRSSNTAAVAISSARISSQRILHPNAEEWLPLVRPAFLALQMGMSFGLARRSLSETYQNCKTGRHLLHAQASALTESLSTIEGALFAGLQSDRFLGDPQHLFELRIALAEIVAQANMLELHACGGSAYLSAKGRGFARRMREAAFIPIITPSLIQLKLSLAQQKKDVRGLPDVLCR